MTRKMLTRDITEVEFERVSEEYKTKKHNYSSNPVVKLLLEEQAILKVPIDTRTYKLGRYLKERGYTIHTRKIEDGKIIWVDKESKESNE